jgi:hypothetical protein
LLETVIHAHHRRALLVAALGFLQLPPRVRELRLLHKCLNNWRGVGHIVEGMARQGYRVSVRNIGVDNGWVATFSRDPLISHDGFAGGDAPWQAVQQAAWAAIK